MMSHCDPICANRSSRVRQKLIPSQARSRLNTSTSFPCNRAHIYLSRRHRNPPSFGDTLDKLNIPSTSFTAQLMIECRHMQLKTQPTAKAM
jgi:hypothetical protein